MKMYVVLNIALAFSVVSVNAFGQEPPEASSLYQRFCAQCHGADLQGGNAQSLVDGVWSFGAGKSYVSRNIKYGITNLGMPAYEDTLNDDQLKALVAYILGAEKEAGVEKPAPPTEIQTQDYVVGVEQWVTGLEVPWGIAFPDDRTALITERPGRLRVVTDGAMAEAPVSGTPKVIAEGQGGLMDIAVDPNYAVNGWVYLAYSHGSAHASKKGPVPAMTRIVRGQIIMGKWKNEQVVFEAPAETYLPARYHFGCRLVFDREGHLYFGIGDRGMGEMAQDLGRPNGKIHRVNPDGTIPADNPFINTLGAIPSVYAFGNRNPQGLAIHPSDNTLWESEHGPMGGDELNVIQAGKNYGWPIATYGREYNGQVISRSPHHAGVEEPTWIWRPSVAVCGIDFHNGVQFPLWENALLVASLRNEDVSIVRVAGNRVQHVESILRNVGRVRDVACGPDGSVYVVTNDPGAVLKLTMKRERTYAVTE